MMTDIEKQMDNHREMLQAMALSVASRVLQLMDENGLTWAGFQETTDVEGAKIEVRAEYEVSAPYLMVSIVPAERGVETIDMGPFVMQMITHGGVHYQIPRAWVETLVRAGETL